MSKLCWVLLAVMGCLSLPLQSQSLHYTCGVTEAGIYTISASQARQLGFQSLNEVTMYGYPGMLPQVLDSAQLSLQEIPGWQSGEALYFYLEGPHGIRLSEEGQLDYSHHTYTDTLRYLLGKKNTPKRIQELAGLAQAPTSPPLTYRLHALKEEKINLLNSGKSWYSNPIRQGQSLSISFGLSTTSTAPWLLHARLMSQSSSNSLMRALVGDALLQEVEFPALPSSTYSIKGNEASFSVGFTPNGGRLDQLRFVYQGTGSGHLDVALVGVPFASLSPNEGIYHSQTKEIFPLQSGLQTWEVSSLHQPQAYQTGKAALGKKWLVFSLKNAKTLQNFRSSSTRNLSASTAALLLITAPQLKEAAQQIQSVKASQGIATQVVLTTEIYDWFGYGNPDITAIRNFIANEYHRGKQLKNVLILGKGTFDYKKKLGGRPNLVPIYTSRSSLDPLTTYSSDDYFGLLDWGQGAWEESNSGDAPLRIGIGRIPAITPAEASAWLAKLKSYGKVTSRQAPPTLTFLADDGDNAIHLGDSEVHAAYFQKNHPYFRSQKLYLDRFSQEKVGTRQVSQAAKSALEQSITQGTLLLNYVGHGNETTLSAEEIFRVQDLENWPAQAQLPLWFTATCEFGRHDSPFIRSAAEELLFAKEKGAIGLLSTGRPVFSSVNFSINKAFMQALIPSATAANQDLGELFRKTKNNSLNGVYNRNFSLLGDPSMRLALPELGIRVEKFIRLDNKTLVDTLKGLDRVQLHADVIDPITQAFLPSFNGRFMVELWDKASSQKTLGDEHLPIEFEEEVERLFVGEGEVKNGKLMAQLLVPPGIDSRVTPINLRLHAWDEMKNEQASGIVQVLLGGQRPLESQDKEGPSISASIGGKPIQEVAPLASTQVEVLLHFEDLSGTNSSSILLEKTLQFRVNGGPVQYFHREYIALAGRVEKGRAKVLIKGLVEGKNEIQVFAWDLLGNPNSNTFNFLVEGSAQLRVLSHQVFPNPASEKSSFVFQHNRPNENLIASLTLYSLAGQILFTEEKRFIKAAEILTAGEWIFLQGKTKYPAKGTYIYKLTIQSETLENKDSVSGKLVIQ
jgi:hypothetical protein